MDTSMDIRARYNAGERNFAGSDLSDLYLPNAKLTDADFSECMFHNCRIAYTDFSRCNFSRAEFDDCNAIGAVFVDCDFHDAHLMQSAFGQADFFRAKFQGTRFLTPNVREAFFVEAQFSDAIIIGSRFDDANFGFTTFERTLISACSFPDVRVLGPCQFDANTMSISLSVSIIEFQRLKPGEPNYEEARKEFLETLRTTRLFFSKAGGVSEAQLKSYSTALGLLPRDGARVFISHSAGDQQIAEIIRRRLEADGFETWLASSKLRGGRHVIDEISHAINESVNFFLILSDASLQSGWVRTEIRKLFQLERSTRPIRLFPITITSSPAVLKDWNCPDVDLGIDLAAWVRNHKTYDFAQWQDPETVENAFVTLLRDVALE